MQQPVTNLAEIKQLAEKREQENDAFRLFLKNRDSKTIDSLVHQLNNVVTPQIDCTACGNCCKSLMINVTAGEAERIASFMQTTTADIRQKYLEESESGKMVISKIPCHFLHGTRCSIYEQRFEGCREFPHLDRDNFTGRLFGTFMYYSMCPIIFNVIEGLKKELAFEQTGQQL